MNDKDQRVLIGIEPCGCISYSRYMPSILPSILAPDSLSHIEALILRGGHIRSTYLSKIRDDPNYFPWECPHIKPKGIDMSGIKTYRPVSDNPIKAFRYEGAFYPDILTSTKVVNIASIKLLSKWTDAYIQIVTPDKHINIYKGDWVVREGENIFRCTDAEFRARYTSDP